MSCTGGPWLCEGRERPPSPPRGWEVGKPGARMQEKPVKEAGGKADRGERRGQCLMWTRALELLSRALLCVGLVPTAWSAAWWPESLPVSFPFPAPYSTPLS